MPDEASIAECEATLERALTLLTGVIEAMPQARTWLELPAHANPSVVDQLGSANEMIVSLFKSGPVLPGTTRAIEVDPGPFALWCLRTVWGRRRKTSCQTDTVGQPKGPHREEAEWKNSPASLLSGLVSATSRVLAA